MLDSELDSLIRTFKTIKADGFKKAIKNADEFATCVNKYLMSTQVETLKQEISGYYLEDFKKEL